MYYRVIRVDTAKGKDIEAWVVELPATIGRGSDAAISIEQDCVSRSHCQLFLNAEGALCVRDFGSTNGTYVNDSKVSHAEIMPGDILQLGSVTLRVEFKSDTDHGVKSRPRSELKPSAALAVTQPLRTIRLSPETPAPQTSRRWWQFWKN